LKDSKTAIIGENTGEKSIPVSQPMYTILSTSNGEEITVDKIKPSAPSGAIHRIRTEARGRKQISLPLDYIEHLVEAGLGYKQIAAKIRVEYGIVASYRTVARVVKGERKLLPGDDQ
jgi:hypothetical protein